MLRVLRCLGNALAGKMSRVASISYQSFVVLTFYPFERIKGLTTQKLAEQFRNSWSAQFLALNTPPEIICSRRSGIVKLLMKGCVYWSGKLILARTLHIYAMEFIVTVRTLDHILCWYHRMPCQRRVYLGIGLEKTLGKVKHHGEDLDRDRWPKAENGGKSGV